MARNRKRKPPRNEERPPSALPSTGELLAMIGNAFDAAQAAPEHVKFDVAKQAFTRKFLKKCPNPGAAVQDVLTRLLRGDKPHV